MNNPVLEAIRARRIARALDDRPLEHALLEDVLRAARWAPSAGNRRLHHFVAVEDGRTIAVLRMVSPGMLQRPPALVLICIDRARARAFGMPPSAKGLYVDVGTTAQTMLLAAHSLGLGAGIVTSFSQAAVREVLNLPEGLSPEMFICLGYASAVQPPAIRPRAPVTWEGLTSWERFPTRREG